MLSPLILDYIACIIYAFILISVVYKKLYSTTENRLFLAVVLICGATTILDLCMENSYRVLPIGQVRLVIAYIFSYAYLVMRQVSGVSYIMLIFVASNTFDRVQKKKARWLLRIPFILLCVLIFSNLFTGRVFTITQAGGYARGPHMMLLYLLSYTYGLFGFLYLCRMRVFLGSARWLSMLSMYLFMILCAVIQMFSPGVLVEMLSTSLALLLVHLIAHWSKDYETAFGLYSWYEFRSMAERIAATNRRCTILILRFVNANEVRTTYGETRYNDYIRRTVGRMKAVIDAKTMDYRIFYHTSGSLQVIFGESGIDIENEYPELIHMWTRDSNDVYSVRIGARLCSLDFPTEHLSEEEDLTSFSFIFPQYMNRDEVYFRAERAIENRAFEIYRKLPSIMSRGIRENRFEMYYQPIYDVKHDTYCSAEALIRLKDPEYGFIPPALFIPSAERRNLIHPIGTFVIDSVFRFAARPDFEELGLSYIELNLSVEQLLQDNLVSEITELQEKHNISSLRINLEITESAAGLQSKAGLQNIADLRSKLFTFSLDDYGTGYSNIQRAVELPLSLVKIDKSIIDRLETPKGESMVRSTIQMMHEIGFAVVSEGVETEAQYRILEKLDCDYIQGYYFAKPMCEADFVEFLKRNNTPVNRRAVQLKEA